MDCGRPSHATRGRSGVCALDLFHGEPTGGGNGVRGRPGSGHRAGTTRTGQGVRRTTSSAVLPSRTWAKPVRPCVVRISKSLFCSSAVSIMISHVAPARTMVCPKTGGLSFSSSQMRETACTQARASCSTESVPGYQAPESVVTIGGSMAWSSVILAPIRSARRMAYFKATFERSERSSGTESLACVRSSGRILHYQNVSAGSARMISHRTRGSRRTIALFQRSWDNAHSVRDQAPLGMFTGPTRQISEAYSVIVRSEENLPARATLRMALRLQPSRSR